MRKTIGLLLTGIMLCSLAACSSQGSVKPDSSSPAETAAETTAEELTTGQPETSAAGFTAQMKSEIDSLMTEYEFEGSALLTQNGEAVWQYANGKDLSGNNITSDTPLPIGSVSKQFCAAAIMKLCEGGKLSVDDTLDKYFPDYAEGKKLTVRNLLTMRSGISDVVNHGSIDGVSEKNTYDENRKAVQKAIFDMSLVFEPDTRYEYSNSNYILLSAVVEKITGQTYYEYLRSVFFEPLGMSSTGSIDEFTGAAPSWANGIDYSDITGLATGAGDIISTAHDMDKWLTGLKSGAVVSAESFREMTENYSTDSGTAYGYGFMLNYKNGAGHPGNIMVAETPFAAFDYFSEECGYNLVIEGSDCMDVVGMGTDILDIIYK